MGACPGPNGHRSYADVELRRRRVRLDVVRQLRRAKEGAERGEQEQELTAMTTERSARSGTVRSRRI